MKTFKDLIVWQKAMTAVGLIYKLTQKYSHEEIFGLTSQTRRCAISIPTNIAEGYGRFSTNDYIRFLNIAMGSQYELQTLLEIAYNLKFVPNSEFYQTMDIIKEVGKMLNTLIRKIRKS